MIMPYNERKSAVMEDFEDFHIKMGYSLEETVYASIGEAEYSKLYSQTDEICIYAAFALMLIGRGGDIAFLRPRLEELADKTHMPQYERELRSEFHALQKDLRRIKEFFAGEGL